MDLQIEHTDEVWQLERCPKCGAEAKGYDRTEPLRWRHLNMMQYRCGLVVHETDTLGEKCITCRVVKYLYQHRDELKEPIGRLFSSPNPADGREGIVKRAAVRMRPLSSCRSSGTARTSERETEKEEKEEGYYVRERISGSMSRVVPLPHDVTDTGASATFKNGVLEIRLKKSTTERGSPINVE